MKSFRKVSALVVLLLCGTCSLSASGKLGFGFEVGQPTGIAWNYTLNSQNSLDGVIGFAPNGDSRLHVDFLWKSYPFNSPGWSLHYGPGAVFGWESDRGEFNEGDAFFFPDDDVRFAIRGVVGIAYNIPRSPVDLFLDAAPLFILSPASGTDLDLGIGVRVYP